MILIYLDESGTNYKTKDSLYVDGPFIIFGAMFINEDVYWSLERLFCQLIDKYFEIENWLNAEVHATNLWYGNNLSEHLDVSKRREFFDEFLQLCGKFGLQYNFSINLKSNDPKIKVRNLDIVRGAHCLLMLIEHSLANIHQTGILVCDATPDCEKLTTKDIIGIDITKERLSSGQALLKEFYAMTAWRSTRINLKAFPITPKYEMEAMSVYLIDRVHFLPSNDSLFLQMCDILTFIVQRSLVNDYLLCAAKDRVVAEKVPVTKDGLVMMLGKLHLAVYNEELKDISIFDFDKFAHATKGMLSDFESSSFFNELIKKHYTEMQPSAS